MNKLEVQKLQIRIGVEPDGYWGAKSNAACNEHLKKLMPEKNPFPKSDQNSLTAFYGSAGDESKLVSIDISNLDIRYEGTKVNSIRCHKRVSVSLKTILNELSKIPEGREVLLKYAGCFNNRKMRGGSLPSLHARGAAIDLNPDTNGNRQAWPFYATMPIEVMEVFAKEGWLCAGAAWGRDAMHFQATA